jgi:transcription factor E
MLKNLLREAVVIISGKPAEGIADLLNNKKYINEFLIAKKLDITIQQTRNILYRISDQGIVSSMRKKDKKKGWYTYFWKIEILKSLEFLRNIILKNIDQITHQIKSRETKQFYACERCNVELSEETALLHNFTCNECGGIFELKDNTKVIREFERGMNRLRERLVIIEEEIKKEKEQLDKKREREFKKEKAEKTKKRQDAAAQRKLDKLSAEKNKDATKISKKKGKKETVIKKKTIEKNKSAKKNKK